MKIVEVMSHCFHKGGIRKFSVSGRRPTGNLPALDEKKIFSIFYFFATDRIYLDGNYQKCYHYAVMNILFKL